VLGVEPFIATVRAHLLLADGDVDAARQVAEGASADSRKVQPLLPQANPDGIGNHETHVLCTPGCGARGLMRWRAPRIGPKIGVVANNSPQRPKRSQRGRRRPDCAPRAIR
jgi:hypothetical protein